MRAPALPGPIMAPPPTPPERHVDRDGVVHISKKRSSQGLWLVGLALGFTLVCVIASLWLLSPPEPVPEQPAPLVQRPPKASAPAPRPPTREAPRSVPPPSEPGTSVAAAPEAAPTGPAEGINLYRQGTKPLKQGLVVPEGFQLPDGYMRHYQTTDDGEQVKPILMFRDDYHPVDANGVPIELPANLVVPPELAPPGMPIEILELPPGPEGVEPIP
jgi:hypothetical protein